MKIHQTVTGLFLTSLLGACGGGGGGGDSSPPVAVGPVISTLSFPFKSAYVAMVQNGYTKNYSMSRDCTGTAVDSYAPAVAATGASASVSFPSASFAVRQTLGFTGTNCPAPGTATGYYDSNYTPFGSETSVTYRAYATTTTPTSVAFSIPSTVVVGATGTVGTASDFNKTPFGQFGTTVVSYVVVPETDSTAVVNLTYKSYDNANTLYKAQQDRYRISMTGALVPLSIDFVQYTGTSTAQLLFR